MAEHFTITKIIVIQSLETEEFQTGTELAKYLDYLTGQYELIIPVTLIECESAIDFIGLINRLVDEAAEGEVPLLHVELHGDKESGLIFQNSSELSWSGCSELLRQLNRATKYNLLTFFAACFGAYFLGHINVLKESPCYAIVAPTEKAFPDEVLNGCKLFYSELFRTWDAGTAVAAIQRQRLTEGYWFGETAEAWFRRMVLKYAEIEFTNKAIQRRSKRLYQLLQNEGKRLSMGRLKRLVVHQNRKFLENYFDSFFLISEFPENKIRFKKIHRELKDQLDLLAKQKK